MLRRALVGFFGLVAFVVKLDQNRVLADFYDRAHGNKNLLSGEFEASSARDRQTEQIVFGKRKRNVANSAEIFSVI